MDSAVGVGAGCGLAVGCYACEKEMRSQSAHQSQPSTLTVHDTIDELGRYYPSVLSTALTGISSTLLVSNAMLCGIHRGTQYAYSLISQNCVLPYGTGNTVRYVASNRFFLRRHHLELEGGVGLSTQDGLYF